MGILNPKIEHIMHVKHNVIKHNILILGKMNSYISLCLDRPTMFLKFIKRLNTSAILIQIKWKMMTIYLDSDVSSICRLITIDQKFCLYLFSYEWFCLNLFTHLCMLPPVAILLVVRHRLKCLCMHWSHSSHFKVYLLLWFYVLIFFIFLVWFACLFLDAYF